MSPAESTCGRQFGEGCFTEDFCVYTFNVIPYLFAIVALPVQSSVTLAYQPPVGATFKYRTVIDSNQNMGPGMDMSSKIQMDAQTKVISRTGGLTKLETKTLAVKVTAPKGSPMAGQTAQMEKMLMGNTTTSTIDRNFKPVSGESTAMNQVTQGIMGAMGTYSFPNKPIKIGESWTSKMDMSKMGGMAPGMKITGNIPIVCKLTSVQGGDAIISMTMNGTMQMEASGQAIKMKLESQGTSRVTIATGISLYSDTKSSYTMEVGGRVMKSTMTQTMRPQ